MDQKLWDMVRDHLWSTIFMTVGATMIAAIVRLIGIVLVYIVARVLLFKLIDGLSGQMIARGNGGEAEAGARAARAKTLQGVLKSVVAYVLFFVAGVMVLAAFSINVAPVLTAAGVVGLAIGFGAQKLVRDVISGFFILLVFCTLYSFTYEWIYGNMWHGDHTLASDHFGRSSPPS
jgi:moderate conductance mechanosensitive channel